MSCTYCFNPTATGIYLCESCADNLYRVLNQMPNIVEELSITATKMDNTGVSTGTRLADSSPPARLDALELHMHIDILINSWAVMLNDYAPKHRRQPGQRPLAYLRGNVNVIRTFDFAGPMLEEFSQAHRDALRIVDLPADIRLFGACPQPDPDTGTTCQGTLKTDGERPTAQCSVCLAVYDVAELEAWNRRRARGNLMSGPDALRWLRDKVGVSVAYKDIRNWMDRGRLRYVLDRVNVGGRATRLVYPGDVLGVHLDGVASGSRRWVALD